MSEFDKNYHDNPDHHQFGAALLVPLAPADVSTGSAAAGIAPAAARADHVHHANPLGFQGSQGSQGFQGVRGFQGFQGGTGTQGFQGSSGGGGSFDPSTDQAIYDTDGSNEAVVRNAGRTRLSWGRIIGSTSLLDLTDPKNPVIQANGIYSLSVQITIRPDVTGQEISEEIWFGNDATVYCGNFIVATTDAFELPPMSITYYLEAGDTLEVITRLDGGSLGDDATAYFWANLIKIG